MDKIFLAPAACGRLPSPSSSAFSSSDHHLQVSSETSPAHTRSETNHPIVAGGKGVACAHQISRKQRQQAHCGSRRGSRQEGSAALTPLLKRRRNSCSINTCSQAHSSPAFCSGHMTMSAACSTVTMAQKSGFKGSSVALASWGSPRMHLSCSIGPSPDRGLILLAGGTCTRRLQRREGAGEA